MPNYLLYMKKFLSRKIIKGIFSLAIIGSAVPEIYADVAYGHQGEWVHYGMVLVGVLYFVESILWVLDIWES